VSILVDISLYEKKTLDISSLNRFQLEAVNIINQASDKSWPSEA